MLCIECSIFLEEWQIFFNQPVYRMRHYAKSCSSLVHMKKSHPSSLWSWSGLESLNQAKKRCSVQNTRTFSAFLYKANIQKMMPHDSTGTISSCESLECPYMTLRNRQWKSNRFEPGMPKNDANECNDNIFADDFFKKITFPYSAILFF